MGYNVTNASDDHYYWYEYDELGRLEYVYSDTDSNPTGRIKEAEYSSYAADGSVAQMKLGNSNIQTVDYSYTVQGWLDKINSNNVSAATNGDRFSIDLDYNLNGNISIQKWKQSQEHTLYYSQYAYTYDTANRLTAADYTNSNSSATDDNNGGYDVSYGYDKNGNITTLTRKGQGSTFSAYPNQQLSSISIPGTSNRLASYGLTTGPVPATSYSVTYDANGNMTQNRFTGAVYNERNLANKVTKGSSTVYFGYDSEGNRVQKKLSGGVETHYVRGAGGETIAIYENGTRAFVNLLGPGGEMMGTYDGSQRRYFLKDHLGSVRTTVDQSGNVDGYDDYYPFGLAMPGRSSNASNPTDNYKFTGHELDAEAGLDIFHMNARGMDPVTGRFMQIDPLNHIYPLWSTYTYTLNNPLLYSDPTGMCPEDGSEGDAGDGDGYCLAEIVVEGEGNRNATVEQISALDYTLTRIGMLGFRTDENGNSYYEHKGRHYRINANRLIQVVHTEAPAIGPGGPLKGFKKFFKLKNLWKLTYQGATKVARHPKFGKFFKSASDGTWWVKDTAGHGGSAFKVYKEVNGKLEWVADADKFGNYISGKHKSTIGKVIDMKSLIFE